MDFEKLAQPISGQELHCKGWAQEAALRMILNNLHPDIAEDRNELVVYGGTGKAARNLECLASIISCLKRLKDEETLLVQSGKPVGILPSHKDAPKVIIANSNLVGRWANWEHFNHLDRLGLMMYGQMTAGSWIYIGTQGILQGTYETFKSCAEKEFDGTLAGKFVFSGGLGGMGGAQPLAAKLAGGVFLGVDVDQERINRRLKTGYLDMMVQSLEQAIIVIQDAKAKKQALSIGLCGNVVDVLGDLIQKKMIPEVLTDQTSAHDELNGWVPHQIAFKEALCLRKEDAEKYKKLSFESMAKHVEQMVICKDLGSKVFDYGNNIREQARRGGYKEAFSFQGFVPEYIREQFCLGRGPFRWVALSGDPKDIAVIDDALLDEFPSDEKLHTWIRAAKEHVKFQGLPSRICWFGYGERARAGLLMNRLVYEGKVRAPIVIGRDHLDCGSVASPYRETEAMKDGSDAVADWPILNALINAVGGASWVSFHHGGGVGMGYSLHSGMVIVADGTEDAKCRLGRVLNSDPAMGVLRHADAGYESAQDLAIKTGLDVPMLINPNPI